MDFEKGSEALLSGVLVAFESASEVIVDVVECSVQIVKESDLVTKSETNGLVLTVDVPDLLIKVAEIVSKLLVLMSVVAEEFGDVGISFTCEGLERACEIVKS